MPSPRVVVVGLGAMGSATARNLAERGADVVGLERFGPAHDRGSSHGDSRIVRRAYFEHPDYVPLLDRAYDAWARLERRSRTALLTRTGALMIGHPDSPVVAGTLASVRRWGLEHEMLDAADLASRFSAFAPRPDDVAVLERDAGFVRPEQVVRTQLGLARDSGADLRFGVTVAGWELRDGGVRVLAGGETLVADHLVVTAGAWAGGLLGDASPPLRPARTVVYRFEPVGDAAPFAPGRMPVFVHDLGVKDALYGVGDLGAVDAEGRSVHAAKIGFHHRLTDADPDAVDREVRPAEVAAMHEVLAERMPGIAGRCVQAVTCLYTMSPDEHFVLGHLPGTEGRVSVFAGCSGHGFKFAPVVGETLADLAVDGGTTAAIGLFDPSRFSRAAPGAA